METSGVSVDHTSSDNHASNNPNLSNHSTPFPIIRFLQAPVTTLIEHSGVLRTRANNYHQQSESLIANHRRQHHSFSGSGTVSNSSSNGGDGNGEVLIRISSSGGQEGEHGEQSPVNRADSGELSGGNGGSNNNFDWRQVPMSIKQILLFSLLLLIVFVRQHFQGVFLAVYITAFSYESNHILRKQTALKAERKLTVLSGYCILFMIHVTGIYWWYRHSGEARIPLVGLPRSYMQNFKGFGGLPAYIYKKFFCRNREIYTTREKNWGCPGYPRHPTGCAPGYRNDNLCNPLFLIPPKAIPSFWNALFIITVNDTMVRQAAMAFKLVLLIYYKNVSGKRFCKQGQMLTLVEYTLRLYRAFLPAPVWYRFFLNKQYGSLFSSLITGLYLTLKLISLVKKIGSFYAALKALSRKEVNYG